MDEKKKGLIVLGVFLLSFVAFIALIIISVIDDNRKLKEFEDIVNSSETHIIYFMKPTCYYCNLLEPITETLKEQYDLKYEKIDASSLSSSELYNMLDVLGVDAQTFGTPYIAIVKDGTVLGEQSGYTDEDVLFELFQKHGVINENEKLKLNYIDKDTLNSIWNNEEKNIVLVGETGNTSSIAARIELMDIADEYSISINYFDTSNLSSSDEYNEWLEKLEVNELPVLAVVENGKLIAKTTEIDNEKYIEFFKGNEFIK